MSETSIVNETMDAVAKVLIRCFLMSMVLLLIWFGMVGLAPKFVYNVHSSFFPLDPSILEFAEMKNPVLHARPHAPKKKILVRIKFTGHAENNAVKVRSAKIHWDRLGKVTRTCVIAAAGTQ